MLLSLLPLPPSPLPNRLHVVIKKRRNGTNYRQKNIAKQDKMCQIDKPRRLVLYCSKQIVTSCCSIYRNNEEKKKCEIFISDQKL